MTRQQGLVEIVETFPTRSFAAADAAISDTVVYVADASQFLTGSGSCSVEIDGELYEATPTVDLETYNDYLTLDPPLLTAVSELDPVTLSPAAETKWAWISLSDDEEDLLKCRVPLSLKGYSSMADGPRSGDGREAVWIETEPEPALIDPPNQVTLFDGGSIDPDTTIPTPALTDGEPPSGSPTPTLEQFAVSALKWSVTPIPNADPVRFRVYADTVDPPTQDPAHLVADSASHSGTFSTINGVRLLPDDPLAAPDPVYVAVVEYDADGSAAMGPTSNPAIPKRADNYDISALYAYLGDVEANQIAAGSILTHLLGIGDYIELDGDASSITIYADAEHTVPLVQLRPDGSVFRGQVIADDVSVLNGLVLQGLLSHIAQNAGVTLDSSISDPTIAPTLTVTPLQSPFEALPSGYVSRGIAWDGSNWLRLLHQSGGSTHKVQTINTSGVVTSTATLASSGSDVNTIVKIGSNWFVMCLYDEVWNLVKYTTAGARASFTFVSGNEIKPAIGTDGTNLLCAFPTDDLGTMRANVQAISPSTLNPTGPEYIGPTLASVDASALSFVGRGNFDFGADRFVISAATKAGVYSESGGSLTEIAAKSFTLADNAFYGGFTWNGSNFLSAGTAARLNMYNGYYPAASENAYVAHRDNNGADHTKVSPISSVALKKRWYVQAALAPAPSGAATPSVWMKLATSTPAATGLLARSETITSRNVLLDPSVAGGSALGTDSNTFGGGTPGWVKSQAGGLELYGDGVAKIPGLLLPATRFRRTSAQNIVTSGTQTKVQYNDSTGTDPTTSPGNTFYTQSAGVITIVKTGLYDLSAYAVFTSNATGARRLYLILNGSTLAHKIEPALSGADHALTLALTKVSLTAGDTLEMDVTQSSGGSLNLQAGSFLSIARSGALLP